MKKVDMTNVEEAKSGGSQRHPAGPYVCKITKVVDVPDKEYLKVSYDIIKGDFAGYYSKGREEHPDWEWFGSYVKSYKPAALPMLKRFCSAVTKSNANYVFDAGAVNNDEQTLVGKQIGLTFREEEYYGNDGDLKTRLIIYSEFPVDKIGEQKVPSVKKLKEEKTSNAAEADGFMNIPENIGDTIPF